MCTSGKRIVVALFGAALFVAAAPALAQNQPEQKPAEQGQKPPATPTEPGKDERKRVDEFAEAARILNGPAGSAECVWVGRRAVAMLWRDDLDTALRHMEIYDRFGCPGDHLQQTFRCVARQGNIDPKSPERVSDRVHACWLNPGLPPIVATPSTPSGTSTQ